MSVAEGSAPSGFGSGYFIEGVASEWFMKITVVWRVIGIDRFWRRRTFVWMRSCLASERMCQDGSFSAFEAFSFRLKLSGIIIIFSGYLDDFIFKTALSLSFILKLSYQPKI
jgi:hypothetical protein